MFNENGENVKPKFNENGFPEIKRAKYKTEAFLSSVELAGVGYRPVFDDANEIFKERLCRAAWARALLMQLEKIAFECDKFDDELAGQLSNIALELQVQAEQDEKA